MTPGPEGKNGAACVLLAEDDQWVRDLVGSILETHGYRVLAAQDGVAALALYEQHDNGIDLLLTDVVMPRMGGAELAQKVMAIRPDIPILYMSGYSDSVDTLTELFGPHVAFLPKPFTADTLAQKVKELL